MKTWAKYLTIGWSIVTVAVIIVSFKLMESHFIEEDYVVMMDYIVLERTADKFSSNWETIAEDLFYGKDIFDTIAITKKDFVDRMKKAKGVTIKSKTRIKDKSVYLLLPLYAFAVWMIPILVFSLVGLLFSGKAESK